MYQSKDISSAEEILDFALSCEASDDQWIYRGVEDSEFSLESALHRYISRYNLSERQEVVYRRLKEEFSNRTIFENYGYYEKKNFQDKDLYFDAFCQHYGIPTPLLDWSRSILVSMFFAFNGDKDNIFPEQGFVSLFALNVDAFCRASGNKYNEEAKYFYQSDSENSSLLFNEVSYIIEIGDRSNRRIGRQGGLFTNIPPICPRFEDYVNGLEAEEQILYKLVIPLSWRDRVLFFLDKNGFSAGKLYDRLGSYATDTKRTVASGIYGDKT